MNRGLQKLICLPGDLGHPINPGAIILDLRCGNGARVQTLRDAGFDALGCDFEFKAGPCAEELAARKIIRRLASNPYRMPFEDEMFDFVFSEQVFEHVRNYDQTLAEIHRVLKPGGVSLHVFPARLRIIEGHVHVPLASIYRARWWLLFWARLGIRNQFQHEMNPREVVEANLAYLENHTNYLSRDRITSHVRRYFDQFRFCESDALRYSRLAAAYPLLRYVPFFGSVLSTFQTRVLFLIKSSSLPVRMARDTVRKLKPSLSSRRNASVNG